MHGSQPHPATRDKLATRDFYESRPGGSVTELNASDGSWVQTLSGGSYGFSHPGGIAADGTRIWVANNGGNSVRELTVG